MNDVLWCVVDFTLHLNCLLLLVAHFDAEDPEVAASQVQRDEVTFLCGDGKTTERERNVILQLHGYRFIHL